MIVDDYGHHPAEIEATLDAAQRGFDRRVVVAFQPHRYTRTQSLFDDFTRAFNEADVLVVTDVYAAGEKPIEGATGEALAAGDPRARSPRRALRRRQEEGRPTRSLEIVEPGRPRHRARRRRHQRERARAPRRVGGAQVKNRKLARVALPDVLDDKPVREEPDVLKPSPRWLAPLRTTAGFVLVAAVSLGVAWGARRYLMTSPRFALEQVVMTGQKTRTKDGLLTRANVKMGQNVFSIDLDSARNKMLGDPYVKSATLARRLPDTILVDIEERVPAAIVALGDGLVLVTRDGDAFKRVEVGDPTDLPVITGLAPELAETDREGLADKSAAPSTSPSTTSSPRSPRRCRSRKSTSKPGPASRSASARPSRRSSSAAHPSARSSNKPRASPSSSSAAAKKPTPSSSTTTPAPNASSPASANQRARGRRLLTPRRKPNVR